MLSLHLLISKKFFETISILIEFGKFDSRQNLLTTFIWYDVSGDKPRKLLRVSRVFVPLVMLFEFHLTWQRFYAFTLIK